MDISTIVQGAAALLLVLALIVVIAWVVKRYYGGGTQQGQPASRRRNRRLSVVEAAQVGARHRLVLVRRDDVEHLILIGGATELLVEADIARAPAVADVNIRAVEPQFDPSGHTPISAPHEHVSANRGPETLGGFSREGMDRPGFERPYRPGVNKVDDRDEHNLSRANEFNDQDPAGHEPGFGRGGAGEFFSADRPGFHRPEPSPFGRSEHSGLFSDRTSSPYRSNEPLQHPSIAEPDDNDAHAVDHQELASDERGSAPDEDDQRSAQSRILNRFLKRDER